MAKAKSQITKNSSLEALTIVKMLIFVMLTSFTLVMFRMEPVFWKWYLTNWGHVAVNFYFFLTALRCFMRLETDHWLAKFESKVYHIAAAMQFNIFFMYYLTVSYIDYVRIMGYKDKSLSHYHHFVSISRHLLDPLLLWVPILYKKTYFDNSNLKYLIILILTYAGWNYYVCQMRGTPVYPIVDWKTPMSFVYIVASNIFAFAGFFLATKLGRDKLN